MSDIRLPLALQDGLFSLPEAPARTIVFRPHDAAQIGSFDPALTSVEHGFRPTHDALARAGWQVSAQAAGEYALAVVILQRAKAHNMGLVARAMEMTGGGPVVIDGQKTDGAEPMIKALKRAGATLSEVISKAHGKLVVARGGDLAGWHHQGYQPAPGFRTAPGMFSPDRPDRGSQTLAAALPDDLSGHVADLGAGWGYLSAAILSRGAVAECHLIEAEHDALMAARANISDSRAQFHWADARGTLDLSGLDHVITNPPFHTDRAATPELGQAFIAQAARLLGPRGTLWLVANRHLPYERTLAQYFGKISELAGDPGFKVFRAERLLRKPSR